MTAEPMKAGPVAVSAGIGQSGTAKVVTTTHGIDKNMIETKIITRARQFATKKHKGQVDDIGLPYILHPLRVAQMLTITTGNSYIIAAGWLHDVLEDTDTTFEELEISFGEVVANLVFEVTKTIGHNGRAMFPNLKSRDAILIKFADRLDNLSRMESWDEERRAAYMKKSMFWQY